MAPSGMLRCETLVSTDVSEELSSSIIRVTRIGELGTKLALTDDGGAMFLLNVGSYKRYGVTSQKTPFFIFNALKTLNFA
jgi:hypothetical protein